MFLKKKVEYELDRVKFFPEEVIYTDSLKLSFSTFSMKANPHPDFGYNPEKEKSEEYFRYRLLLRPTSHYEIKYELFKFKYPIFFYFVTLYADRKSFNLLEEHFPEKGNLKAENIIILKDYITKIIQSESTIELISRLIAL